MFHQLYIVDSFTDRLFRGNPAAVCILSESLPDSVLQSIAAENNLSETAFFSPAEERPYLRWFTPQSEIDLCGHATLAAGFVALEFLRPQEKTIKFNSMSGPLTVTRDGDQYTIDLPLRAPQAVAPPAGLFEALGVKDAETLFARDYIVVLQSEREVREISPRLEILRQLDGVGVVVTAPGDTADFVSRAFFPKIGVDEDPVTGSTHCALAPYWGKKLGKRELSARQVSSRGGELLCSLQEDRVFLTGSARLYMRGEIAI
jgi:PhzF family phenazine biosynthesis protein